MDIRRTRFAVLILFAGFALRVALAASRPIWYDEAFSVLFAEKGWAAMMRGTLSKEGDAAAEEHPLAYYVALDGWMQIAGQSPLAVRYVSVLAGTLTLGLVFDLGRRLFGPGAGFVAAALAALSPFHVYYSQEARMYAAMALAGTAAVWCLVRGVKGQRAGGRGQVLPSTYWLGLSLASALMMYLQSLSAFFLLTLGLATLPRRRTFAPVALAGLGALALYLPWLAQLPGQFAKIQRGYWLARPTFTTLLQTLLIFNVGEEFLEAARPWLIAALFVGLTSSILLVFQFWRAWRTGRPRARWAAFVFGLAGGPALLMFLASFVTPVYLQRALMPSALMYYLALGWAATAGGMPRPVSILLLGLVGAANLGGLAVHYTFDQFPRPNFPALTEHLAESAADGDLIVHSNKLTFLPAHYYDRDLSQSFVADPPGAGSNTLSAATQQTLGVEAYPTIEAAATNAGRVWFVIFDRAIAEYQAQGEVTHPHLAWLEEHFRLAGAKRLGDAAVYEFVASGE